MKKYIKITAAIYLVLVSIVTLIEFFRRIEFYEAEAMLDPFHLLAISIISGFIGTPFLVKQVELLSATAKE